MGVLGVLFVGDGQVAFFPQLGVRLHHSGLAVGNNWVAETRHLDRIPRPQEDQITHQNLVLESGTEVALLSLFHGFLELASNSRDCFHLSSLELSHLNIRVEHTFDKGGVSVDFVRLSDKFELLHDVEIGVQFDDHPRDSDTEVTRVFVDNVLEADESRTDGVGRPVENTVREAEFGSILDHAHFGICARLILHRIYGDRLEFSPAH